MLRWAALSIYRLLPLSLSLSLLLSLPLPIGAGGAHRADDLLPGECIGQRHVEAESVGRDDHNGSPMQKGRGRAERRRHLAGFCGDQKAPDVSARQAGQG